MADLVVKFYGLSEQMGPVPLPIFQIVKIFRHFVIKFVRTTMGGFFLSGVGVNQ